MWNEKRREMDAIPIIESNEMMRLFLANYLGKNNNVKAVSSPSDAIKWLEMNSAALIISDYQKKFSEGYTVKNTSQLEQYPNGDPYRQR